MVFQEVDFLKLGHLLSQEERLVKESVRAFVEDNVIPTIEDDYMEGIFPVELVRSMGQQGYLGAQLEGYGCAGLGSIAHGLMMQELERGDSSLRSFASVQGALVMYPIHAFGSDAQRDRWLPRLQSGEAIGCFGLTEPDFGSNPAGMRTHAVKEKNEFVLNGTKAWITNGSVADVALVWARFEEGVQGFLVEKGTPGFTSKDYHNKHSLRASITSELSFDHCRIPDSNRLPEVQSLKNALMCLNQARYGIAWGVIGSAMTCYDSARRWCLERRQFAGKPIASHQLIQNKLAHMLTEITKAQLLAFRLGKLKDSGELLHEQISMAKRNNVAMALEVARMARDILGANGIVSDYPVWRHMANLETVSTYEGTHDIHALILGESITGIAAFE
jgi:glutaryl-CoA dehydrogenase